MKNLRFYFVLLFAFTNLMASVNPELKKMLEKAKEASLVDSSYLQKLSFDIITRAEKENDQEALSEIYIYLGNNAFYSRQFIVARKHFENALKSARNSGNNHWINLAQLRLFFVNYDESRDLSAENDIRSLLIKVRREHDYENVCEILNLLGIILEEKGQTEESAKLYHEGIGIAYKYNLPYYQGVFHNNIGLIKIALNDTKGAVVDFENGLRACEKINHHRLSSHILLNLCVAYLRLKKHEEGTRYLNKLISYAVHNNFKEELISAYMNIGMTYSGLNQNEKGMKYVDSALTIVKRENILKTMAKTYFGKANIYNRMGQRDKVRLCLDSASKVIAVTKNLEDKMSLAYLNYDLESRLKNYSGALENYIKYIELKDSVEAQINSKTIAGLQSNYLLQKKEADLEKEKTERLLLEKENQEKKATIWFMLLGALIVLILVSGYFYFRYNKSLQEKQEQFSHQLIEHTEGERSRIARDLHDDLGQNLSVIKTYLISEVGDLDLKKRLNEDLSKVINQTREISRNLYPSYLEKIGLTRAIASTLEKTQQASGIQCSFEIDEQVEDLSLDQKTHLFRIVQECINNTLKHSGASALKIDLKTVNDEFSFTYRDNGIGLGKEKTGGLGFVSMKERAKILGGSITIEDIAGKGIALNLNFPKRHT